MNDKYSKWLPPPSMYQFSSVLETEHGLVRMPAKQLGRNQLKKRRLQQIWWCDLFLGLLVATQTIQQQLASYQEFMNYLLEPPEIRSGGKRERKSAFIGISGKEIWKKVFTVTVMAETDMDLTYKNRLLWWKASPGYTLVQNDLFQSWRRPGPFSFHPVWKVLCLTGSPTIAFNDRFTAVL